MDLREALQSGIDSLRAQRLRAFLTMLGMIFGVGAVIAMLSIGAGAEAQAMLLIDAMGVRNVVVQVREPARDNELLELRRSSVGLSERDARAIAEAVPGVARVAQKSVVETYKVLGEAGRAKPRVFGVSPGYFELQRLSLLEGRFFDPRDEAEFAQVCVIGENARRELFGFGPALGRALKVNERWLTVVGVLGQARGAGREVQGVTLASTADDVYLPVTTAQRKFAAPPLRSALDELVVEMEAGHPPQLAAAAIETLLLRLHGGAKDFALVVPEALLEQSRRTQRLFDLVMGSIAGISLLVGGIGIMNIMLATVMERTREIGIRRAIGATRKDIRNQFVIEAFTLAATGGLLGVVMGVAISKGVALWAGWETVVTLGSILLATLVSVGVGLVSGLYPATRAAALDPIESLRYE
jgi:putative ABC transport system permease protein